MAKKNQEIKENEELKEEVVQEATTEVTEEVEEIKENEEEIVNSDVDLKTSEESIENPEKEEKEDKSIKDKLVANTSFNDKYTGTKYEKDTEFIICDVKETEKIDDKKYKISKTRAKELKASGYVD